MTWRDFRFPLWALAALLVLGGGAAPLARFEWAAQPKGLRYSPAQVSFRAAGEKTPSGDSAGVFTLLQDVHKVAHDVQIRLNARLSLEENTAYRLSFFAKADRSISLPWGLSQTCAPWRTYQGGTLELGPQWRRVDLMNFLDRPLTNEVLSVPFLMPGLLPKGTAIMLGPVTLEQVPFEKTVAGKRWRPLDMDDPDPVYFKPVRLPLLDIVAGTALDLSQFLPRHDIDANGRLLSDAQGRLVFAKAPGKPVRLRGFNCTQGGAFDGFSKASKEEIEALAEQIRRAGLDFLRFHFFDAKFAGHSGMDFYPLRNTDLADIELPETPTALAKTIDTVFLDRFHWFVKCLRDRGVYVMFDIFTSPGLMARAAKGKGYPRFQMFTEEKYRNHWKAAYAFWMETVNPYTHTRFLDDPQVLGITFYNEQEHLFGEKTDKLKDFTPAFRAAYGAEMPEFSLDLLRTKGPTGDKARQFLRARVDEMNDFYLDVVKASGFKGFVTNWDMFMRNLEGVSRRNLSAVAMHPYHAHPSRVPTPAAALSQQSCTLQPWVKGTSQSVSGSTSIALNNYIARAAVTRVLGKPFFLTEFSHCGGNPFAQEAPVVQTAAAALQDWQVLAPHSDLVKIRHYGGAEPFNFDSAASLMARVASLATAFGWQRGDVKSAPHAVSFHVPEDVLATPSYMGAIGSAYNSLCLLTRVGSDYARAHNPVADLDVVPASYVGATSMGMWATLTEDVKLNDRLREEQVANLRTVGVLPKGNRTDPARGLFESETGEIFTDVRAHTQTIDAPRFQAAALKAGGSARLSQLEVASVSVPTSILAISLDEEKDVSAAGRLLLVVATRFRAENSVWGPARWGELFVEEGRYRQLMEAGRFQFSLKTGRTKAPTVYALRLNGTRAYTVSPTFANGRLALDLDTSAFEYATPYFEIVYEGCGR